ncbi:MAG: GNAT family N-acetyltransferase [Chitinophagaceae bacterium]
MSSISIRFAVPEDAALIAELSQQTFLETFADQNSKENMDKFMNETFSRQKLMSEVNMTGNIFLLAYSDQAAVGYVRMRENNLPGQAGSGAFEIARIYATANTVGKGVGRLLMQHCIDIAREKGKELLWLGVWEHNYRAIEFYKKWGFEKFSTHTFMLGDDPQTDWLMKKEL